MFLKNASELVRIGRRIYRRPNGRFGGRPPLEPTEEISVVVRIRPSIAFAALVVAAAGVLVGLTDANASTAPSGAYPAAQLRGETGGDGWSQTPYGPLGPGDRDLVVRVRQAGLWEMPMGQLAQTRGTTDLVRQAGGVLASDHMELDIKVRAVAAQLGVPLPDQPSAQQQAWMAEIRSKTGVDFDRTWAQRLRYAHGVVFNAIAAIRTGTRNTVVRQLAQTANTFVMRHMTVLENTGMVDYGQLPTPPAPSPTTSAATVNTAHSVVRTGAFGTMKRATLFLVIVVVLIITTTLALDRDRPGKGRRSRLKSLFTVSESRRRGQRFD